jgi:4,5-DOPA dioxygenase extradiol
MLKEQIMKQPALFISHGAPDVAVRPSEIRTFLRGLSGQMEKPSAIVIASAHFETAVPEVVSDPSPETVYDFGGFDPALREIVYPAKGSPEIAGQVLGLLKNAGIEARINPKRGFDHGVWTPLFLAYPDADIPVIQISIQPGLDAEYHYRLGVALAKLRDENMLVVGSGHITHNLRAIFGVMQSGRSEGHPMIEKVAAFTNWIEDRLDEGTIDQLLNWTKDAPFAAENHPTDEHFMPFFVALGAGSTKLNATLLHRSTQYGFFVSDIWRFD